VRLVRLKISVKREGSFVGLQLPKGARNLVFGVAAGSAALLLSGCSVGTKDEWKRIAMPDPASAEAPGMLHLWQGAWIAALAVGVVTWGLILYAVIRFRRRSEDEIPVQTRYNLPIEIFYTVAPIMMVIVFFFFTVKEQDRVLKVDNNPDNVISVVGQQWSWTFNYNYNANANDFDGEADGSPVVHEIPGTPADPPTLWLPKDETVEVNLYSADVIHSFWVPAFLFKMDVFPGRDNHYVFTPTRTGTYEGRCAELCGVYHSRMLFKVKVVTPTEYDAHLAALARDSATTGPAVGGSEMNTQAGLEQNGANE
jgi:cytochrome c oxidase subunit 2